MLRDSCIVKKLKFTLKAWPVIALATIGLCYLTQLVSEWIGHPLPQQANVDLVRKMAGWNLTFLTNIALITVIMPAFEETVFRLPTKWLKGWGWAAFSSTLFSAAHYFAQPWPDNAFLALFFFALAQCWLMKKTNLFCAILNHGLFNLTNLVLLFTLPESWLK